MVRFINQLKEELYYLRYEKLNKEKGLRNRSFYFRPKNFTLYRKIFNYKEE